jgi:hypothetical protein
MKMQPVKVQDLISRDMFESIESGGNNEMLEILQFIKAEGTPLTEDQIKAWFMLSEAGVEDIALFMNAVRPMTTPTKKFFDLIGKITLADRIRGSAKLSNLLKAQVTNPNNTMPSANDLQAKALKEKELGR